jgi:hypothetical protein
MSNSCDTIRVKKKKLCAGDLRHLVRIMDRTQRAGGFSDPEVVEDFIEIARSYMAIKTIAGTRISGRSTVNDIQIQNGATHIFYCRRTPVIERMDISKTFLLFNGEYYRVIMSDKINEDNLTMLIQCALRGDSTKAASEA